MRRPSSPRGCCAARPNCRHTQTPFVSLSINLFASSSTRGGACAPSSSPSSAWSMRRRRAKHTITYRKPRAENHHIQRPSHSLYTHTQTRPYLGVVVGRHGVVGGASQEANDGGPPWPESRSLWLGCFAWCSGVGLDKRCCWGEVDRDIGNRGLRVVVHKQMCVGGRALPKAVRFTRVNGP